MCEYRCFDYICGHRKYIRTYTCDLYLIVEHARKLTVTTLNYLCHECVANLPS